MLINNFSKQINYFIKINIIIKIKDISTKNQILFLSFLKNSNYDFFLYFKAKNLFRQTLLAQIQIFKLIKVVSIVI